MCACWPWLGRYACVLAPLASDTADAPSIPAPRRQDRRRGSDWTAAPAEKGWPRNYRCARIAPPCLSG
eukprot:706097-Prymnesium_polylepis.1